MKDLDRMFPSHLPIVMQKLGEAERERAAENHRRRASLTDTPHRINLRSLRVPRIRAKGATRRPAAKTAVRST
jgi:hypothetical protein